MRKRNLRALTSEASKYLLIGGIGYLIDAGLFNIFIHTFDQESPWLSLEAKFASAFLAIVFTFFGNKYFTFNLRKSDRHYSIEVLLFIAINLLGMGINIATLWFSHYVLGFTSLLADNISGNLIGTGLATAFRFYATRTFVFRNPQEQTQ